MQDQAFSTTLSSREFNQDVGRAKRASQTGPVLITERGRPAHVLLTFEEYKQLAGAAPNLADLLDMPDGEDIEFEPPRLNLTMKIPDLS